MKLLRKKYAFMAFLLMSLICPFLSRAQINTEQVMIIGRNALYFEDYVLSIQYFNQVIKAKPYLAEPYFFRAVAKFYLEDFIGAEQDCDSALARNPFIVDAYQVRGIARQTLGENEKAIEDYDKGLEYLPESKLFLINKAIAQQNIKDYDGAKETYDRLTGLYPNYDNAFLGRAQLEVAVGDTLKAMDDIARCISLNKNNVDAYVMRAGLRISSHSDYKGALEDMDNAIKLEPRYADFFVNRAFLKYNLDDYFGAMSDFDYAISLDPLNIAARFNRGLLRMEVQDDNRAIDDFSYVVEHDDENVMALYNRATLYQKTGQYSKAIADYDRVLSAYPNLTMLYYARSECKRLSGDMKGGERDYKKFRSLENTNAEEAYKADELTEEEKEAKEKSPDAVMKKFKSLMTVENNTSVKPEYEDKYRGRVQNYNVPIDMEDMYILSYFDQTDELRSDSYYQKEIDEINRSHYLRDKLYITNIHPRLSEEQIQVQFDLIRYYTSLLNTAEPRAIDYFGRAMSFIMVKNYASAIEDLERAIAISPNFVLAYFAKAMAYYYESELDRNSATVEPGEKTTAADKVSDALQAAAGERYHTEKVLKDLDKVIELSPRLVYAYFNKGNLYLQHDDYTAAISCYTEAVEIKPDFGEAYYNRGLVYLRLGNREKGIKDLSKAGELGIMSSYNVLKRMSK